MTLLKKLQVVRTSHTREPLGQRLLAVGPALSSGCRTVDEQIGLVLADQRMPGMTGVEFLEQSRNLYPKIEGSGVTVIAVSPGPTKTTSAAEGPQA